MEALLRWNVYIGRRDAGYIGSRMLKMEMSDKRKRRGTKRRFIEVVRADVGDRRHGGRCREQNMEKVDPLWQRLTGAAVKR